MNNFQLKTPVVLIIFNRPETTEKVFAAIRKVRPLQLFVIADGPRQERPGEAEKCAATRAIINRVDWNCEILTNYSRINLGCRQRVYSGLNWVFERVESAIILEDDCVPHPTFFQFCQELLEKYRNEPRIATISGDNFQFGNNAIEESYYFSRYAHCWGWATWRRAWKNYDDKMTLWPQLRNSNWLQNLLPNAEAVRYWSNIFDNYEKFNSWAYIWVFSCWSRNGLTILPEVNLVSNIGFNEAATHTSSPSKFATMATEAISFPLKHPTSIIANIKADNFTERIMFSGSSKLPAGAIATTECKVCGSTSHQFDKATILNKYDIDYFQCGNCGFIQTENPYWLAEAYAQPIASSDVGLVGRNIELSQVAENLMLNLFDRRRKILDYGCGYGLFVRLMREAGFDCYGCDRYCQNIFYRGFEGGKNPGEKYELVTAFEVLEHLVNPLEEIENLLQFSRNLFFSTKLLPDYNPKPKDWWYYALSEGQHISIYTKEALGIIAKKFQLNFYSYGDSFHLLTEKKIDGNLFNQLCRVKPMPNKPKQLTEAEYLQEIEAATSHATSPKKQLKVLVDGVFFQLNNTGIARVWRSLLIAWVANGFASKILVLNRGETAPKIPGIKYRNIPRYDYAKTESDRQMLQQICEEEKADLFISTYYTTPVSTPSVFMAYDMTPEVFGQNLKHPEWREKHEGIRRAVSYITISQNTARDLIKYFPNISPNSVTVAPCGVDVKFSPANAEKINNLKSKYGIFKPYFLLVGERVGWQNNKNAILLFQAFSQLANNLELEIVCVGGKQKLEPELEQYVSGHSVKVLQLTDDELKAAYSGAVALVYPSKYEGFGMPIVEAMACGCPVITCQNSSLPEVAGNAAVYVGDRDVNGLTKVLAAVQKPQVRQQLIAAGLEQKKQFSWSKMAKIVSSVLQDTAERIASQKPKVNEAQLALQRQFWNVSSIDKAMFGRVLAYEGIEKLSPEERREIWEKSIPSTSEKLLKGVPAKPEWKLLEIGCGVGRLVKHFRESFARVDGVDISANMIQFAKQYLADGKQNGEVYVNNGSDLQQLPDESYDFVYSTIVFQHIRSLSIVKNYFREIFRVLKPGGYFRIQVHDRSAQSLGDFDEEGTADKQYFFSGNAYTDEQLKDLLIEPGFQLVSLECSKPWIWATVRREFSSSSFPPLKKGGRGGSSLKVSAIVSTYNSEQFIQGCLEDLIDQTLYKKGELEIIIIDSASEEKEGAIASQFQTKYPNIVYHRTAQRETIYAAWNRGIKLANGEYITNANTDDRHRPDALETLADYLDKNQETSLVYADQLITAIPNETWEITKADKRWNWPEFNYNELEKRCIIGPQPMWRKSLHEKCGYFREEFSVAGDYEFWLRIGQNEKIVGWPEILGLYYQNKQGLENVSQSATQETHKIWQEYGTLQRGVVPEASVPTSISEPELKALPYRQSQPLVSVIIPCYNYAKYLPEAVASVVNQTYQNWECIIVNDGSSDNTSEVAKYLIKLYGDQQIRLLEKSNSGVAETRNLGIGQSAGAYILCLDADDKIHPSFIEETAAALAEKNLAEKNQVGFVYTDFEHFGSRSEVVTKGDFDLQKFLRSNQAPVTSLFRREIFEQTGGFKKAMVFGWEDWEFWVAACELGWVGHRLPKPYLLYRVHPAGSRQQQIHSSNLFQAVHFALIINLHSRLYTPREVQWSEEILRRHGSLINWGVASQPSLEQTSQQTKSPAKIEYPSIQPVGDEVRRPLFSVMLPTYNPDAAYLEQTLNSVLQQDLGVGEMQIEVVDDCSTAVDVEEIVNKIGKGRISFCRQEQNLGQIANWNDCIRRSRGEWVHILHQDDLVLPGFYRQLRGAIDPPPLEKGGAFSSSSSAQIDPPPAPLEKGGAFSSSSSAQIDPPPAPLEKGGAFSSSSSAQIDPPPAPLEKGGAFSSSSHTPHTPHTPPSSSSPLSKGGRGGFAAAFCRYYYIDGDGSQRFPSPLERETAGVIDKFIERIAIAQRIQFATVIVKRSVYEQLGGFCSQAESAADWEMWKRIAAFYPIWFEPEILACFRLHSSSETSRLMRSGENIANARKAIEISQSYLPKTMAEELSNQAKEHYAMEALKMAASMLTKDDANGAIAQMREGLKCSQSPPVINLLVSVLVGTKTETTTSPLSKGGRGGFSQSPIPHSSSSPLSKGGRGGFSQSPIPHSSSSPLSKGGRGGFSPFPKVIIDGVMFQIYESGITRVWRNLLTEWAKQGLGEKIIVLDRNNTAPKIVGINYREAPAYDYNKTEADRQILQHLCDAEKADIFISTYYTTPISTPSVFVAYDMIPELMGANTNNPMWKEKHFAIDHASGYVAISQNTAKDLVKCFPNINAESVTVAYCGFSSNFYPAKAEEIYRFKNKYGLEKQYFLWVGDRVGFNGYKNALLFCKAIAKYPRKEQLEIVFVGGGSTLEPKLQSYVRGVKVNMLRLSDEELRGAYSGALALVQTSKYEGFGLPILEAIACGCPVITHANSSIPEVAGNAAFYIGDSVAELVKAMLEIQKLEVRQPLIAAGLERAKNFSWTAMANAVGSAIIQTVNGEFGSPPAPLEKGGEEEELGIGNASSQISEVKELEKHLQPSLGEIKKAIETYREKQADKSALIKLQEIRKQVAEIWLNVGKLEELRNAYSGEIGQAHKALLESGIKDESLTQIEQILVGQVKANIAKGFNQSLAIKYLLAGMLYQRADELGIKYEKAPIPNWFATDYLKFMFASPQMFQEIGEADNYYRFLDGWLSYVRENISANPNSELWRAIAWLFVQNSNWIPLYFTSTPNLKNLYLKRAEIVEFALKNRGLQLDYPIGDRSPYRQKIRLGILKDHYAPQTETYSLLPAFEHLDRSKFEIILYAVKSNGHPLEQYCQSRADKFLRLPDDVGSQAQTIRNDDLDILFVGSNVTAGMKNSTLLAMHRLARVQVTSINSPTTTGMRNLDYYIAGSLTAPVETAVEHYTEKLVNMEGSGLCFRYAIAASSPAVQPIRSSWGATEETTIFISGANFYKIIPEMRETWAKILAAVPDSILVLYPFNPNWTSSYRAAPFVQQMRSVLERHGIDRKRLVVIKALPGKSDIEQCLQLADVYLDSFPYGGATSLVDPLTVGVPPVVVEGDALRFRQASAMLREIGMEELIADSEEGYINLAVKLATDSQWRRQKREEIKAKMQQNPPFLDSRGYSAKMGALLEGLLAAGTGKMPVLREVQNRRTGILPVPKTDVPEAPVQDDRRTGILPVPETDVPEAEVQHDRRTGILPVPEAEVQAALSSEFLNRVMGCVNLYEIEPEDESLLGELRQLRLELAAFWMGAAPEQLESLYGGEIRQAYGALLACGFQSEALTEEEEGFLQHLTEVSSGLSQPKAVNALLGAMLYFPPGKMRVRDARSRLPHWLIEDYESVFESLPQLPAGSEDPPRPPLERGEEEVGNPPQPPFERGEEEGNLPQLPLERGEKEGNLPQLPEENGSEEVETEEKEVVPLEQKFVNEVLGGVHLYYVDPSDESVVARLRELRRQMADLCLQLPAEELEGFYRGETGKGFRALLGCGFQNEPMQEEEVALLQQVAIALAQGVEAPKALNHLLAAMLYCRRGQLQVEDTSKLPEWFVEDYQKFATGESPLVVAG